MTTSQEIADRLLSIPDARYADPGEDFTDIEIALSDTDFDGIAIKAPAAISSSSQREVPLVVATKRTGLRGWEVPGQLNSVLVATDVLRRKVYIAPMFPTAPGKMLEQDVPPPARPTGASAIAEVSAVKRIDARRLLALPLVSARYRFTALMFDWKSNAAETSVTVSDAPLPATTREPESSTTTNTAKGLPTWLPSAGTPAVEGNPPTAAFRIEPGAEPAPRLKATGAFCITAVRSPSPS